MSCECIAFVIEKGKAAMLNIEHLAPISCEVVPKSCSRGLSCLEPEDGGERAATRRRRRALSDES